MLPTASFICFTAMDGWSKKKTKKTKSKRQKTTETTGGSSSSRETIDGPTLDGRSVLLSDEGPAQKNKKKREKNFCPCQSAFCIYVCVLRQEYREGRRKRER
jgi:hypothetical protein